MNNDQPIHPAIRDMMKRQSQEAETTIGFSPDTFFFPMDHRPMKGHMAAVKGRSGQDGRGRGRGVKARRHRPE